MTDVGMFSLDAEDLFYSMPRDTLLVETRECLRYHGMVPLTVRDRQVRTRPLECCRKSGHIMSCQKDTSASAI